MLPFTQAVSKNLTLFCTVVLLILTPGLTSGEDGGEIGTVMASRLNVRKLPGKTHTITHVLEQGAQVRVIGRHEGWLQIYFDDQIGYIKNHEQYVKEK